MFVEFILCQFVSNNFFFLYENCETTQKSLKKTLQTLTNEGVFNSSFLPGKVIKHVETSLAVLAGGVVFALTLAFRAGLSVTVTSTSGDIAQLTVCVLACSCFEYRTFDQCQISFN